jgi:hypothetical protein
MGELAIVPICTIARILTFINQILKSLGSSPVIIPEIKKVRVIIRTLTFIMVRVVGLLTKRGLKSDKVNVTVMEVIVVLSARVDKDKSPLTLRNLVL